MDTAALRQELINDPAGIGYGLTRDADPNSTLYHGDDDAIAVMINAPTRNHLEPISGLELIAWGGGGATDTVDCRTVRIAEAAADETKIPATDQQLRQRGLARKVVRGAAVAANGLLSHPELATLDLSKPDRRAMLQALIGGGVLTQAEGAELAAMTRGSRARELGFPRVLPKHVRWARQ